MSSKPLFATDAAERKKYPIYSGVLCYFPAALAQVAKVSYVGNEQHNPGQPLHWARGKSMDQGDTTIRHMMDHENEPIDTDGTYHLAKAAWRILAALQIHLEEQGAPLAPGAVLPEPSMQDILAAREAEDRKNAAQIQQDILKAELAAAQAIRSGISIIGG